VIAVSFPKPFPADGVAGAAGVGGALRRGKLTAEPAMTVTECYGVPYWKATSPRFRKKGVDELAFSMSDK
jgi:hypothetical protein